MTLHVLLRDSNTPAAVPQACIERSPVLAEACASDLAGSVRLPCDQSVWTDWAEELVASEQPLAVAKVRALPLAGETLPVHNAGPHLASVWRNARLGCG